MDTVLSLPRLNEPAPNFGVKTTHGKRKLADYKGKWLILFSHSGDFRPVRSTFFIDDKGILRDAEKRSNEGYEYTDWYFSKKGL